MWLQLILLATLFNIIANYSCRNEDNEPVDWFMVYKLPKIHHSNQDLEQGTAYMYLTSKNYQNWSLAQNSINDSSSMIAKTLAPLYSNPKSPDFLAVIYNDEPPNHETNPDKGHTKGVVLADSKAGFWLIHSVPHFPLLENKYGFPSTGVVYGQSFLCISLDLENLNKVGIQLQYNEPQIFFQTIPLRVKEQIPNLAEAAANKTVQTAPWYHQTTIISGAGTNFISYAKSRHFNKELYEDWIAPSLHNNLYVETWSNGAGKLPSNCSKPFKVYNVETVSLLSPLNASFTNSRDHSKWAVTESDNWLCIGDINRMEHQKTRGGGTVCLNNQLLALNYQKLVTTIEKCN